ncbi:hypothetical protein DS837_28030 [Azospirillum brasilense]|uniref:Uncharacterized protein n=1 Tax=Azospirillum brasilense TaxID=192 RepID=A0A6L3AS98_AZOBR|nr:hypothetical protein DS837_28030 [Azospirillum brasilense]
MFGKDDLAALQGLPPHGFAIHHTITELGPDLAQAQEQQLKSLRVVRVACGRGICAPAPRFENEVKSILRGFQAEFRVQLNTAAIAGLHKKVSQFRN